MGIIYKEFLDGATNIIGCASCKTHLSTSEMIISKAFQGQYGKAYLMDKVINIYQGDQEDRLMSTGRHRVCDIYCNTCHQKVGWMYLKAFESSQKYKEGKYILEAELMQFKLEQDQSYTAGSDRTESGLSARDEDEGEEEHEQGQQQTNRRTDVNQSIDGEMQVASISPASAARRLFIIGTLAGLR